MRVNTHHDLLTGTSQHSCTPSHPILLWLPPPCCAAAGAFGCTISGAGPTAVAVVPSPEVGAKVAEAMGAAFKAAGLDVNSASVVALDPHGAKFV